MVALSCNPQIKILGVEEGKAFGDCNVPPGTGVPTELRFPAFTPKTLHWRGFHPLYHPSPCKGQGHQLRIPVLTVPVKL